MMQPQSHIDEVLDQLVAGKIVPHFSVFDSRND